MGITLDNFEVIPGVVINTDDPLNQCRVKAVSPGLFDTATMSEDDLLWISPLFMIGNQSFSKLTINSKIWIIHNITNYFEYWYIPMFELTESSSTLISNDSDIMVSRSNAGENVSSYYNNDEGFVQNIGDNKIQLNSSGELNIESKGMSINANEGEVFIGSSANNGSKQQAVLGNNLSKLLSNLATNLSQLATVATGNPYTATLGTPLQLLANQLNTDIQTILSNNVSLT